jgi:undecaprenyl-diphosphatase
MIESLKAWDTELFLYLNQLGSAPFDFFWLAVSGKFTFIPLYLLILIGFYRQYQLNSFLGLLLFVFLTVLATDQGSVQLFKEQFMRLRPCYEEALIQHLRLVKEGCGGKYGFLSSHASNTFGLALFAGLAFWPRYRWPLFLLLFWAAAVGFSRIYLGVHYPLDVMAGALFGAFCGWIVHLFWRWTFRPKPKRP